MTDTSDDRELIWLDCDPGHDDFFAINMAGLHPNSKLIGISTSGGNQTVEKVTINALNALYVMGLHDVPCVAGSEHALMSTTIPCPEIHGHSGLDVRGGYTWPKHTLTAVPEKAIHVMARTILAQPKKVHLIATGRLTNVALLVSVYPEVLRNVLQISIMGGAGRGGNTHPVAEFNIQGDPEAAQIVFNVGCSPAQYKVFADAYPHIVPKVMHPSPLYSTLTDDADDQTNTAPTCLEDVVGPNVHNALLRVPVVLVPLEITHTVLATKEVIDRVHAINSPYAELAVKLFHYFRDTYERVFKFDQGPPVHDPCAVLYCLEPKLYTATHYRVDVECGRGHCTGQTVVDIWGQTRRTPNVIVSHTVDIAEFWNRMIDAIAKASKQSPLTNNTSSTV